MNCNRKNLNSSQDLLIELKTYISQNTSVPQQAPTVLTALIASSSLLW